MEGKLRQLWTGSNQGLRPDKMARGDAVPAFARSDPGRKRGLGREGVGRGSIVENS